MYSYLELVPTKQTDRLHASLLAFSARFAACPPKSLPTAVQSKGERKGGEGISL